MNFNSRFLKTPIFVIDHAIVHELAHVITVNLVPRIWNIVGAKITKAKTAWDQLNEHGLMREN